MSPMIPPSELGSARQRNNGRQLERLSLRFQLQIHGVFCSRPLHRRLLLNLISFLLFLFSSVVSREYLP